MNRRLVDLTAAILKLDNPTRVTLSFTEKESFNLAMERARAVYPPNENDKGYYSTAGYGVIYEIDGVQLELTFKT